MDNDSEASLHPANRSGPHHPITSRRRGAARTLICCLSSISMVVSYATLADAAEQPARKCAKNHHDVVTRAIQQRHVRTSAQMLSLPNAIETGSKPPNCWR